MNSLSPRSRLERLTPEERSIVTEIIMRGDRDAARWIEKLRRFASLYGRNLDREAAKRFGTESNDHLNWMAKLLLEGSATHPQRGNAPADAASLSAAFYCIDAAKASSLEGRAADLLQKLDYWLCSDDAPQPASLARPGPHFDYVPGRWLREATRAEGLVILSPSPFSLFTLSVMKICQKFDIPIEAVVLRTFSPARVRSELKRDGVPLLAKRVYRKLIVKGDENSDKTAYSLKSIHDHLEPATSDVRKLAAEMDTPVISVKEFTDAKAEITKVKSRLGLFTGGGLIDREFIDAFDEGIINVHMGPLPEYKGMDVVEAPLLEGRFDSVGLTTHLMEARLDRGPVVLNFATDPTVFPSRGALRNAISAMMPLLLVDSALALISGRQTPIPQDPEGRQFYFVHRRLTPSLNRLLAAHYEPGPSSVSKQVAAFLGELRSV